MNKEMLCGFAVGDRVNWTFRGGADGWQDVEVVGLAPATSEGEADRLIVECAKVRGRILCEQAEHVKPPLTNQDLADEYRRLCEREIVVVEALQAAGFTIVKKYHDRIDYTLKPRTVMGRLKEVVIEKSVTTTESI